MLHLYIYITSLFSLHNTQMVVTIILLFQTQKSSIYSIEMTVLYILACLSISTFNVETCDVET